MTSLKLEGVIPTDQIAKQLAEAMDIRVSDARDCIHFLFDILRERLMQLQSVHIHKFGTFRSKPIKSKVKKDADGKIRIQKGVIPDFEPHKRSFLEK